MMSEDAKIYSGRCHGPRCQQAATDGPWCSTACQEAWHTQFHWLHGDGKTVEPVLFSEPDVVVSDDAQAALDAALAAAQPALEQHLADTVQAAPPAPFTVAEVARIASSLPRTTPEPAKLTREQFDALTRAFPDRPGWCPNGELGRWDGVPVEIVETVEESTPYQMAQVPSRVVVHRCGSPEAVEELLRRIREARIDGSRWLVPTSAGATYQQVAPPDPQVGVVRRAFRRLGWSK